MFTASYESYYDNPSFSEDVGKKVSDVHDGLHCLSAITALIYLKSYL